MLTDPLAIAPAAHSVSGDCVVHWESLDPLIARLQARNGDVDMDQVVDRFADALLDHTMRVRLQRETEPVRRLILAQAFSQVDLLHPADADMAVTGPLPPSAQPDRPHQRSA